jgi:hypothetical protein
MIRTVSTPTNSSFMSFMENIGKRFAALTDEQKARVLGRVAFDLTISARGIPLEGDCQTQLNRLVAANEFQHKALSQMLAYLSGRNERYSDEDIVNILRRIAEGAGVLQEVRKAFENAMSNQSLGIGRLAN